MTSRVLGSARVAVSIALGLALLGGGVAYAGYRYDAATSDRLLPGVRIAGVDVGEMTRADAVAAISDVADDELSREIEIVAGGRTWHVTPAELGSRALIDPLVDRAMALNDAHGWMSRVFRRITNREVAQAFDLRFEHDRREVNRFIASVAEEVNVDPANASVDFVDGELVVRKPKAGWALPEKEAFRSLLRAVVRGTSGVELSLERLRPEVTTADLGYTIVVRLSELKLYLYDGVKRVKTYPVAAGQSQYPTPQGEWTVINKAANPTWTNPAPTGWGADLPAYIGPGPSNPLGTRALYLDAPGIRIHGTAASSSIGTYASHGCIRMHRSDVEELFEIVPVGTPVHVVS